MNQIPLRELTVSLFRASAPKELLNQISKEGYIIEKQSPGIYYVNGLSVPTQIVVTNELNSQNHESLKVLSKSAQTDDIQRFTELASAFTEPGDKEKADAVLQVSVAANRKNYDKVRRTSDMCEALRELFSDEIEAEKARARREGLEEGREEGIAEGRAEGREEGIAEGRAEERAESQSVIFKLQEQIEMLNQTVSELKKKLSKLEEA